MIRIFLMASLVIFSTISTSQAEETNPCQLSKTHFVTVAQNLFKSGDLPADTELVQLKAEQGFVNQLAELNTEGCTAALSQQMQGILNDIEQK